MIPPQLNSPPVQHCWHFVNKAAKGTLQQFPLLAEQNLVGRGYTNRTVTANTEGTFCIQTQTRSQCAEGENTALAGEPRQRRSEAPRSSSQSSSHSQAEAQEARIRISSLSFALRYPTREQRDESEHFSVSLFHVNSWMSFSRQWGERGN